MKIAAFLLFPSLLFAQESESLLDEHPLTGETTGTIWTSLSAANSEQSPDDPWSMTGTLAIADPGYAAGDGLYSWRGAFATTVTQESDFDIQQAVYQVDILWDPATSFPYEGGPKLNYNGGGQMLSPQPLILGRSREIPNETGIPEMEHLDAFVYRGVTWQWDLSSVEAEVTSVSIAMPHANHTAVIGVRIDATSEYQEIGGTSLTPLELWRQTYFDNPTDEEAAADQADPDGDGLANLLEYALGTRPDSAEGTQGHAAAPQAVKENGHWALSCELAAAPPSDVIYQVQASSDLSTWKTLAQKSGAGEWAWQGDGEARLTLTPTTERTTVIVGDDSEASTHSQRYFRLHVSHH